MPVNKVYDKSGKPVKKDGKQKYRVRINYTDSMGRSKQIERTAYGADEAKQLERELNHSVKEETPTKKMTFGQLYEEYIEVVKHEVKEITLKSKEGVLIRHVLPMFEKVKLSRITPTALQQWKQAMNDKNLSAKTKQYIYMVFHAVLRYAVRMEYLPHNPLDKVGNFKTPMEEVKEMDFYTPEEFLKFIDKARINAETSEKNVLLYWCIYVFFCTAYYSGMRESEILALNWHDIENGEINITKSYNANLEKKITPPKSKKSIRRIQIPTPLQIVFDEHYERCKSMPNFTENFFIFGGIKPISIHAIKNNGLKFAEQARIKSIRIHDFRHSHASLLANNGINIQEISRRLGHADTGITLRTYAHLYPTESERAMNVLNNIQM